MTVLVFGAGGQTGRELTAIASRRGLFYRGLTRAEADITDKNSVARAFEAWKPTAVVNCAAYTAVDRAESEPLLAHKINTEGAAIVGRACAAADIPLVHLSTDYVFDGRKIGAYNESDDVGPINVYGKSKAEGEREIRAALANHVILRTSWVYGQHGGNFLKTILRLATERDELRVVSDQYGCPTSTADIAEAIIRILQALAAKKDLDRTYHFASPGRTSWHEFACEIVKRQSLFTGRTPSVTAIATREYPTAAKRPTNSELDSAKFTSTFGYRAKPWQERVAETVETLLAPARQSRTMP